MTSSSFSHQQGAPEEAGIVWLCQPTNQTAEKFPAKSCSGTKILDSVSSYLWQVSEYLLFMGFFMSYLWSFDFINVVLEQTCFIQSAMASWVSLSRDWICWMNVTLLSLCRRTGTKWCQVSVCECVHVCMHEKQKEITKKGERTSTVYDFGAWLHQQGWINLRLIYCYFLNL